MTKIRLARTGSTHQPHYRIVVADSRDRRDGRFLEILGAYHPLQKEDAVTLNNERASYWLSVGAQPSNTVISLLTKAGVKHSFKVRRKPQRETVKPTEEAKAEATEPAEEIATAEVEPAEEAIVEAPLSDEAAAESSESAEEATPDNA